MENETETRDQDPPTSFSVDDTVFPSQEGSAPSCLPSAYDFESVQPECGLCSLKRRTLYCGSCATKGDFIHSGRSRLDAVGRVRAGNMAEKRCEETVLQRKRDQLKEMVRCKEVERFSKAETREEIVLCRQRIKYLNHLVKDAQKTCLRAKEASAKLLSVNELRRLRLPLFVDKVDKISRYVEQHGTDLSREKQKVNFKIRELAQHRNRHTQAIFSVLFPIDPVMSRPPPPPPPTKKVTDPNLNFNGDSAAISEVMADAMSTSFIQGRWVTTSFSPSTSHSNAPVEYRIAGPALSAQGDYSAFPALVSANQLVNDEGEIGLVPTISAGLAYTSQLLTQLYACWNEVPPKKISYVEFGVPTSSQYQFAKKIIRLNLNVIYLCLRLGIDPQHLKATHTLHNLHLLVGHRSLGISPFISPGSYHKLSIENCKSVLGQISPTPEDLAQEESEDDDCRHQDGEWETISTEGEMMIVNLPQNVPDSSSQGPSSATSFVTSWFRGFTNNN